MRVHLILSNQKIFNSIVCVEVSLASFPWTLLCLFQPCVVWKLCRKTETREVWGSVCDSMQIQLCRLFAWETWCNFRSAPSRTCLPLEQSALFGAGGGRRLWLGLWDMENLIGTMGFVHREIMFMCWKGTVRMPRKQGLPLVCGSPVIVHLESALSVCRGTRGARQTLSITAQKPPKGPWGFVGKEFKSNTW